MDYDIGCMKSVELTGSGCLDQIQDDRRVYSTGVVGSRAD